MSNIRKSCNFFLFLTHDRNNYTAKLQGVSINKGGISTSSTNLWHLFVM